MNEQRLIELEIKAAYQDDLLQTLNDVIGQQQRQIDRLEQTCTLLHERIVSLSDNRPPDASAQSIEVPPHY